MIVLQKDLFCSHTIGLKHQFEALFIDGRMRRQLQPLAETNIAMECCTLKNVRRAQLLFTLPTSSVLHLVLVVP